MSVVFSQNPTASFQRNFHSFRLVPTQHCIILRMPGTNGRIASGHPLFGPSDRWPLLREGARATGSSEIKRIRSVRGRLSFSNFILSLFPHTHLYTGLSLFESATNLKLHMASCHEPSAFKSLCAHPSTLTATFDVSPYSSAFHLPIHPALLSNTHLLHLNTYNVSLCK